MGSIPETVEMVSTVAENPVLENGGSSMLTATPKYKRRRVSAVRDFPPGCGPNAPQLKSNSNGAICCSENAKDTEQSEHDHAHNERKPENSESAATDPSESFSLTKCVNKMPEVSIKDEQQPNGLLLDSLTEISLSKWLQVETEFVVQASSSAMEDPSEDSKEVKQEITTGTSDERNKTEPKETLDTVVTEENMVVEEDSLPYHPIPKTVVWKDRTYPPRRRVSAVRDFPEGCGTDPPLVQDSNSDDPVQTQPEPEKDMIREENMQVVPEVQSEEGERSELLKKVVDDGKIETGSDEGKECKQMIVYRKHKGEQKRATIYSDSSIAKQVEKNVSSNQNEGLVIVFALMAPNKDRLKQEVGADKASSSASPADFERRKKSVADKQDKLKLMEDTDRVEDLGAGKASSSASPAVPERRKKSFARKRNRCKVMEDTDQMEDLKKQGLGAGKAADLARRKKSVVDKRNKMKLMEDTDQVEKDRAEKTRSSLQDTSVAEGEIVVWDERNSPEEEKVKSSRNYDVALLPFGTSSSPDRGARFKVRETLRLFQAVLRKLLQEHETKPKKEKIGRIDQQADKILRSKGKYVNTGAQIIGPVPGVEVGDEFHYRVELMMIGLHRQSQSGIDCTKIGGKVIATSIVASGGYENEVGNSDVLKFSGQGGNVTDKDKKPEDQKLERGNLGLKNSIEERNFVRVIRGVKETKSSEVPATYTYDGLYTVERYWQETGKLGNKVYKFELKRVPNQPELVWKEVTDSKERRVRQGRCVDDISQGKERFPISAVNTVDDEKPPAFTYITRMMYPDWCNPLPLQGCHCTKGCSDSSSCPCTVKNGGEIPYNFDGAIVEEKPLVYECGPACKCPSSCHNRVSQHGMRFQLEIFKTGSRGWGVRSLSSIRSGSFICEYIGELLEDTEAEQRSNDEYLFDIGQEHRERSLWEGLSDLMPDVASSSKQVVDVGFTIDAAEYGNVGRFINHSCSPNLYAQNVLYDHTDSRMPHVMLFAAENIPPLQELTYHYNYKIGQVLDKDGKAKVKNCYCGSSDCEGRMY